MIIIFNNKNKFLLSEFDQYQNKLRTISSKHELILCPSSIYLSSFDLTNFHLGSQDVSIKQTTANTGEITASQLKSLGVKYTIVGHSERRFYQKETNIDINKKIKNLLELDITPILCIGETIEQNKNKETKQVLITELNECLQGLEKEKVIIAYEPIWTIGTGKIISNEELEENLKIIKELLPNNKIVYGGSVNETNIIKLKEITQLDGYLLGKLSLNPDKMNTFLNNLGDN